MSWEKPTFADKDWELIGEEIRYQGFFRVDRLKMRHRLFAGGWSGEVQRELFLRGQSVGVLLYDPVADRVALLEQFRVGALNDERGPWLLEIVAGMMKDGESPEEVALREVAEETGLTGARLVSIGRFLLSPGGSDESITLYCGLADLSQAGGVHGLDQESEDIRVFTLSSEEAFEALRAGRCNNAPAAIALQWLQLNREPLRAANGGSP